MKIALITLQNANNYGAVLQTFAMQKILEKYGVVDVINYENRYISRSLDLIRINPSWHGVLGAGKDVFRIFPRYRVIKKFKEFIDLNINLTQQLSHEDLKNGKAGKYDAYIAGSDQIWNPACVSENQNMDLAYFLDFVPEGAKKISYASSVGGYQFTEEEENKLKFLLSSFNHLSVREKNTQDYLASRLEKQIDHVLDPTLLLSKQEWIGHFDYSGGGVNNEKYILLYTVPKSPLIKKMAEYFADKLKLKIISIDQGLMAGATVDKQIRDAGPKEFLELFAGAEFVITDSFHGTCFALNYEKSFVVASSGKHTTRIESLLTLVGLEKRLIKTEVDLSEIVLKVDFCKPIAKLEQARKDSMSYIERVIN